MASSLFVLGSPLIVVFFVDLACFIARLLLIRRARLWTQRAPPLYPLPVGRREQVPVSQTNNVLSTRAGVSLVREVLFIFSRIFIPHFFSCLAAGKM